MPSSGIFFLPIVISFLISTLQTAALTSPKKRNCEWKHQSQFLYLGKTPIRRFENTAARNKNGSAEDDFLTDRLFHRHALPSVLLPSAIIPAAPQKGKCEFCHIFACNFGSIARFLQKHCLQRKCLAEFRPAGRNKVGIHFIRRLCRPEKYRSPCKCRIFVPKGQKLCAQSRRIS